MAGAYLTFTPPLKKPLLCSISSFPNSKLRRRTNHLREKLLKTLTKPYSPNELLPIVPLQKPIIPIEPENVYQRMEFLEVKNVEKDGVVGIIKGEFGRYWLFKLGFYMVGIFVLQMICTILIFGSEEIVEKDEKDSGFGGNLEKRSNPLPNGSGNLEERVGEIRALAREVRESERLKSKEVEEESGGGLRTGIEMEVDRRLAMVQKKLQSSVKKMVREKDDFEEKDQFEKSMIKKKYKFRAPSGGLSEKPKGFGTKVSNLSDNSMLASEDEVNILDSLDQMSRNISVSVTPALGHDTEIKQSKERSIEVRRPGKKLEKERMRKDSGKKNGKAEPSSRIGETQEADLRRHVRSNKSASKIGDEQSNGKASQWWSSLPYVVAVMMGRGQDGEGPRGLFTLKSNIYADDEGDLSRIVAFEDRGDANNFCFILESFFEDLGDFSADIVPLSTKELEEEVKSLSKNVVVVRKRQLKLYAGQPLSEVEIALRSLIE